MATKKFLGEHPIEPSHFHDLKNIIKSFKSFKAASESKKNEHVNQKLLELIQTEPEPCFLLPAVLEFIEAVEKEKIVHHYSLGNFELWLNHFSGLSFKENRQVRGKIAGKWVERSDFQNLFPIGMGKVYEGTHFVTAHKSPDLDSTIASFWGWLDAFAARVGEGLHVWNLPDGPPPSQIEIDWIFRDIFGSGVFTHLPKMRTSLTLTGNDLMSQKGMQKSGLDASIAEIDHDRDRNAVVVVDKDGYYLGDWRAGDVEGVRQVIILLSSCLRWFENSLQLQLISLFSQEKLSLKDFGPLLHRLLGMKLQVCEPALEFSRKQSQQVENFLKLVLRMKKGLSSDFEELAEVLSKLGGVSFGGVESLIDRMKKAGLFDGKGHLIENRPQIFTFLEGAFQGLHLAIVKIRARMEKLDIAMKAKFEVFEHRQNTVTVRSDVEEIRNKMAHYSYLTVVNPDKNKLYPLGVIQAQDLRKSILGTVSLRDFCNRDEMGIPPYLEVISVIDHHKTSLNTFTPPMAALSDAQSSNTVVAQKAFEINDAQNKKPFFVHPQREFVEYLHFLYGIIDDTDLLTKVSALDVQVVASLLNRMKSLSKGKKTKIIDLDDLPRDRSFPRKAAARILRNDDMYSLYSRVYKFREEEVEKNINLCSKGEASNLFSDTKEQNGCCRIGQTKMFAANVRHFERHADAIRRVWVTKAIKIHKDRAEIDLHLHMTSTIVNAEEVHKGKVGKYIHKDELWIWIPRTELAVEHLKRFLSAFQGSSGLKNNTLSVEFLGANADELSLIFKESFLDIPQKKRKKDLPVAVLKYKAGSLNSRKAMVSPFLPTLNV